MSALMRKPAGLPGSVHPPIEQITDALSFKVARLSALNERTGGHYFKSVHDITLNQWRILGLTAALGPVPSRQVRDILYMDKGQFSRVVKQLTERGLIQSAPRASNASASDLIITETGQALHDVLISFTAERNASVVSTLTPEECTEFLRILDKISAHNQQLAQQNGMQS